MSILQPNQFAPAELYGSRGGTNWFVDSVSGSDANNGIAVATPFSTLAKLQSVWQTGDAAYLKCGSTFREQFILGISQSVYAYGFGNAPIVSGADLLPNASFTLTTGQTVVYQISLPSIPTTANPYASINSNGVLMVWDAGVRMGFSLDGPSSIAGVATAAGSFWWDATNKILYMHASDGSNIITNGRVYEASTRTLAITGGDYCYVENLVGEKAGIVDTTGQQGYGILGYRSGYYKNCTGQNAWNHAIGVANNQDCDPLIFDQCMAYDCERIPGGIATPATLFVAYRAGTVPTKTVFKDCFANQPDNLFGNPALQEIGFYGHGTTSCIDYEGVNFANNTCYGAQFVSDVGGVQNSINLNGSFVVTNCIWGAASYVPNLAIDIVASNCLYAGFNVGEVTGTVVSGKFINCGSAVEAGSNGVASPTKTTLINAKVLQSVAPVSPDSSAGVLTINTYATCLVENTLFHQIGSAYNANDDTSNCAAAGTNNNHFSSCDRVASNVLASPGYFTSLANWVSATGLDAASDATTQTVTYSDFYVPTWPYKVGL